MPEKDISDRMTECEEVQKSQQTELVELAAKLREAEEKTGKLTEFEKKFDALSKEVGDLTDTVKKLILLVDLHVRTGNQDILRNEQREVGFAEHLRGKYRLEPF